MLYRNNLFYVHQPRNLPFERTSLSGILNEHVHACIVDISLLRSEDCGPLYAFFVIHHCGVVTLQPKDVKVCCLLGSLSSRHTCRSTTYSCALSVEEQASFPGARKIGAPGNEAIEEQYVFLFVGAFDELKDPKAMDFIPKSRRDLWRKVCSIIHIMLYKPLYWCNSAICVTHAYFVDHAYMNHMQSLKQITSLA